MLSEAMRLLSKNVMFLYECYVMFLYECYVMFFVFMLNQMFSVTYQWIRLIEF